MGHAPALTPLAVPRYRRHTTPESHPCNGGEHREYFRALAYVSAKPGGEHRNYKKGNDFLKALAKCVAEIFIARGIGAVGETT